MADSLEPLGGWAEILKKVSSPTDVGIIFAVGPIAFLFWFFAAPAFLAALPAATFAILVAVFVLGLKKLAVDARQERSAHQISHATVRRFRALQDLAELDIRSRGGNEVLTAWAEETNDYVILVDQGLVEEAAVRTFIDGQLQRRQNILSEVRIRALERRRSN